METMILVELYVGVSTAGKQFSFPAQAQQENNTDSKSVRLFAIQRTMSKKQVSFQVISLVFLFLALQLRQHLATK